MHWELHLWVQVGHIKWNYWFFFLVLLWTHIVPIIVRTIHISKFKLHNRYFQMERKDWSIGVWKSVRGGNIFGKYILFLGELYCSCMTITRFFGHQKIYPWSFLFLMLSTKAWFCGYFHSRHGNPQGIPWDVVEWCILCVISAGHLFLLLSLIWLHTPQDPCF